MCKTFLYFIRVVRSYLKKMLANKKEKRELGKAGLIAMLIVVLVLLYRRSRPEKKLCLKLHTKRNGKSNRKTFRNGIKKRRKKIFGGCKDNESKGKRMRTRMKLSRLKKALFTRATKSFWN